MYADACDKHGQWRSQGVLGVLQPPYSHGTHGAPQYFSSMSEEEEKEEGKRREEEERKMSPPSI